MRLKVEGLDQGQKRGIHFDVNKKSQKKASQVAPMSGALLMLSRTMEIDSFLMTMILLLLC